MTEQFIKYIGLFITAFVAAWSVISFQTKRNNDKIEKYELQIKQLKERDETKLSVFLSELKDSMKSIEMEFGQTKIQTWQADTTGVTTYAVGDRRTDSAATNKQYRCIVAHTKGATSPASDLTNWAFDFDNYQTYDTTKTYVTGSKTNYSNEHYICVTGQTGSFNVANWSKVVVSNKDVPFLVINTAINLVNTDSRFGGMPRL